MTYSYSINDLPKRLLKHVEPEPNTGCWISTVGWCRSRSSESERYSQVRLGPMTDKHQRRLMMTHRYVYELLVGPIETGKELDHKCSVRQCCNPAHLHQVTRKENLALSEKYYAKQHPTHCKRGHELTPENTRQRSDSGRICLACYRPYAAAWQRDHRRAVKGV